MPSNIELFEKHNRNKIFIETGSYAGEGIKSAIFAGYKEIHSIEITEKYYHFCKNLFKYIDFVNLYHGDSVKELPDILSKTDTPITFWLDAHYSGGDTDFNGTPTPLMQELEIIKNHSIKTHSIIIDDLREWRVDFPAIGFGLDEIKKKMLEINSGYSFSLADGYIPEDVLVAEVCNIKPINIIIFSKDRASQLDLFIRSFNRFVTNPQLFKINVLYTYSNDTYKRGYDKLIGKGYPNVIFKKEMSFKSDLLSLINTQSPHTVFFVDDNVFKNPLDFYDKQMDLLNTDDTILCRSLRLHPHLTYCYPQKKTIRQPVFKENNVFCWHNQDGDYGYPLSVDGHIYRTNDILPYIKNLDYTNPNDMEGKMAGSYVNTLNMVCYEKSVIINNPINMVQTNNPNVHGNITAEQLNKDYLEGRAIRLDDFVGIENKSCHQEVIPTMIDESVCN